MKINSSYALVIGGANIDFTAFTDKPLIWKDSNPGTVKTSLGGVGRNIAENLARLNVPTKLLSVVGDDAQGEGLIRDTAAVGVDMSVVEKLKNQRTSSYFAVMDNDDMAVAIADMDIIDLLTPSRIEQHRELINQAKIVILDTNLTTETLAFLLTIFPTSRFFLDPVSVTKAEKIRPLLAHIDTLKPNRLEAECLTGIKVATLDDAHLAIDSLLDQGINNVYMSLGSEGSLYGSRESQVYEQSRPITVINATGAGDSMMASIAYGAMNGLSPNKTLQLASLVASITLQAESTIAPNLSEDYVLRSLREMP